VSIARLWARLTCWAFRGVYLTLPRVGTSQRSIQSKLETLSGPAPRLGLGAVRGDNRRADPREFAKRSVTDHEHAVADAEDRRACSLVLTVSFEDPDYELDQSSARA